MVPDACECISVIFFGLRIRASVLLNIFTCLQTVNITNQQFFDRRISAHVLGNKDESEDWFL